MQEVGFDMFGVQLDSMLLVQILNKNADYSWAISYEVKAPTGSSAGTGKSVFTVRSRVRPLLVKLLAFLGRALLALGGLVWQKKKTVGTPPK